MRYSILVALLFTGMVNAQIVNIPDPNFKAELISQSFDLNADGEIQLSEAQARTYLEISTNTTITSLEGLQSFTTLTNLVLVDMPLLTTFDISTLVNLQMLRVSGMPSNTNFSLPNLPNLYSLSLYTIASSTLNLSNLTGLTSLVIGGMPSLTSLSLAGNTSIRTIYVMSSQTLGTLNVSGCTGLTDLSADNASISSEMVFNSVNLAGCIALRNIKIIKTSLSTLDVSGCTALETFKYEDNRVPNLDLSGLPNLISADVRPNGFSSTLISLNLNDCTALNTVSISGNLALKSLYIKNGRSESINIFTCPGLTFVCVDDAQLSAVQTLLNNNGLPNTACSSYCSFTPGGDYNTISGSLTFDANNNGCGTSDPIQPHIKVNLGSPITGSTFTNTAGNYTFYTLAGTFQWAPDMENPSWFNIAPTVGSTVFANNSNNTYAQNFCISANGSHPDLEIVVAPVGAARPGFSSSYKVVYKNKGNQTLSGTLNLNFDDSRLDFLSATPNVTTVGTNTLNWSYSNLLPFESRAIIVGFDVNSPGDTPAVNSGDILPFSASITPLLGDEIPADNAFSYNQVVVGSMDPNQIICLEGGIVAPSQIGNYLHYSLQFENTGNAPAENVVVKITVDTNKYDINSLQLLNTSNPSYTRITGNVAEFIFEDIYLSAASGNPPVGGHGDVLFKIRSKNTLVSGDQVSKSSKIFFDYNLPITTNMANTVYQSLSIGEHSDTSISIAPNPAQSIINITSDSIIKTIELYDMQGRLLETSIENSNDIGFDISSKQNGIYFLKIKSEKGSKVEKVVKK